MPSRNVKEATSLAAISGVPGMGVISATASALELASKVKFKSSPGVGALFEPYAKQKKVVSYMKFTSSCKDKFTQGQWGSDETEIGKNVADFESGKKFGAYYTSNDENAFELVFVFQKTAEEVLVMTPQEWQKESAKKAS